MDSNNNSRTVQTPVPVQAGEPAAQLTGVNVKAGDWRRQIHAEQRQKIIKKIIETLKQLLPSSGQDGTPIQELEGIAIRFEEKIYAAANSQSDYLRKISSKMLSMEKSQTPVVNSLHYNSAGIGKNPTDPATNGLQSQVNKQEQPLSIPMTNQSHEQQQLLYQNNMRSNGGPNFTSRQSAMPPVRGFTQAAVPNVVGENPSLQNIQNVSTVAQNSVENSMGPGMPSNTFGNSQRQMQTRQQRAFPQPQQQQSQNPQEYLSKQQLQHQLIQLKYQQGSMQKPAMQSDIEQQQQQKQQPSVMQSAPLSNLQQNQQSSVQQSTQSMLQQYPQPVRQQQQQHPQQVPIIPQQQASIPQQAMMATQKQQQQQQMIRQQPHRAMQQNQLSQPNIISDLKQQKNVEEKRVIGQQNNMSDLRQQQLIDQHGRLPNRHQRQVVSTQFGTSSMASNQQSIHVLQQSKIPIQPQMQQTSTTLQQQLVSQIQTQPAQTQQLVGLQQQTNPLQMDMRQSLQTSSMSGQPQNLVEQQKQLSQSQQRFPEMSSTSFDSMAQTGSVNGGDWQEEVYQKIKTMKEMYFARLAELYQRICAKLKQNDSGPQQLNNAQLEHMKLYKVTVERYLQFLRLNKNQIQLVDREKVGVHQQKIVRLLRSRETRNTVSSLQRGSLPQPNMHAMQPKQQPLSQNSQMHSHENQVNPQMQSVNVQAPGREVQQNSWTKMQHNSMSSASNISSSHQDIINTPQPTSNLDVVQSDTQNSLQHVAVPSLEPNLVSGSQQMNARPSALQSQMNTVQLNLDTLQPKSNLVQHQHLKQQEEQMSRTQQLKQQLFQGQRHQQLLHKQQQQQQPGQLPADQISQLHQMTNPSDLKQHHSAGQLASFYHQKLKSGTPFPVSTTQGLPTASSEVSQHSSPQIDQPSLLKSLMQSSSSPFIVPSPSTPVVPSPIPVDSEKVNSGVASLLHAGIIGHQQTTVVSAPSQSLSIDTPGISASPLVADFTSVDGTQGVASTIISDQPSVLEQPHERLMRLVNRSSARALSAAVSDISSVVSTADRIAGSAPGNGSRAGIGEDLAAVTNSRLHVGNSHAHHRHSGTRKMKRYTSGAQSNVVSSAGSVTDFFCYSNGSQASDVESTATSPIKRLRVEANNALVEEIREINQRLIDTVVDISDQESDSNAVAAALEGCEGAIVKCSFNPVALSPNLKLLFSSAQLSPIQPLRLLVPNNYPICSPIFLDKFPVEISKEYEDFSMKAMARLKSSLRNLSHPMSLGDIVRTWDVCARAVISGYAQQNGGGSFSSIYGTWERCLNPG